MTRSQALSQYHQCAKRHNCPGEWKRITSTKAAKRSTKRTTGMMRAALRAIRKNRKQTRKATRSSARLRKK